MPRSVIEEILRSPVPLLTVDATIADAVAALLSAELPALPVVDPHERLVGVFGEREFFGALFPGYVRELRSARFLPSSLDEALERRSCGDERIAAHVNREQVHIAHDASDVQVAEVFLHHRVLLLPVVNGSRVVGAVTRSDFFRALARRVTGSA